ncbi:MAG: hypothetical protein IKE49_03185, partial [Firmicutes bacterium]|nr:hypothetical protein [Bacillota bacterium]
DLLSASQVKEEDEDYKSKMDFVIEDLRKDDPDHFAVRQYEKFKMAAGDATMGEQSNQLHIESLENRRYVTA